MVFWTLYCISTEPLGATFWTSLAVLLLGLGFGFWFEIYVVIYALKEIWEYPYQFHLSICRFAKGQMILPLLGQFFKIRILPGLMRCGFKMYFRWITGTLCLEDGCTASVSLYIAAQLWPYTPASVDICNMATPLELGDPLCGLVEPLVETYGLVFCMTCTVWAPPICLILITPSMILASLVNSKRPKAWQTSRLRMVMLLSLLM